MHAHTSRKHVPTWAPHAQGAVAATSSASLSLKLSAHGLGPRFRMLITARNDGTSHVHDIPVVRALRCVCVRLHMQML